MRRAVAMVLAMVLLFSGCSLIEKVNDPSSAARHTAYAAEYENNWAYTCLSANQRSNYGALYAAVRDGFGTDAVVTLESNGEPYHGACITLPYPVGTEDEIQQLYQALMQDNPAFFYIGNAYGYGGITVGGARLYDTVTLTYTMTAAKRADAWEAFVKERDALLGLLNSTMTVFERELILHDALLTRCRYDEEAAADMDNAANHHAFTAYGALVEGKAVCEGYAHAMQYLLNQADIPATVVIGYDAESGEPHMWNAVSLEGQSYYLDPTWDDNEVQSTYTFFNVTAADLQASHRLGNETLGIPPASATEHNYYRMTENYLQTPDQKEIADRVAAALTAGETASHLRFSPEAFESACFFVKNASWFTETVNACLPVGVEPLYAYQLLYDQNYHTVTICKKTS